MLQRFMAGGVPVYPLMVNSYLATFRVAVGLRADGYL